MKVTDFFNSQFSDYAQYDSYRSISNFTDGFKPTARKLICCIERDNIKEPLKLSSLVNNMITQMEYLHGPTSAEGAAVNLAQDFAGSNNINLMRPAGSFGTRTIPKAAASRYIKSCKMPIFDKLFNPLDKHILISQEFEGTNIEPRFYIPIIPMLLVNGNEGIGNGFAQKILSRNTEEIISFILKRISGKKNECNLLPYFKGFNGIVKRIENYSYEIIGCFNRIGSTTLNITELPIGYDLEKYNAILTKLEDEKIILDFTDKSEENSFLFEVKVTREFLKKDDDWILQKLKLIRRVTENFTCIGERNQIVEFNSDSEIMEAFIKIRLEYYDKRKAYQIEKLKDELLRLGARYTFIKNILDDTIKVNKKSKLEIETQIRNIKTFPFDKFEDLNFLLNMPIHSMSKETFEELKKNIDIKKQDLKDVTDKTIENMWTDELKMLQKELK